MKSFILFSMLSLTAYSAPTLEFVNGEKIDLGTFESRLEKKAVFKIKNSGDETLKIQTVRKTCGCFKVESFPKELETGKSGEIKINVEAYGLKSSFSKLVFVKSNDSKNKIQRLQVSGKAVPLYKVFPSEKFNAGNLVFKSTEDKHRDYTFTITPVDNQKLILDKLPKSDTMGVDISLSELTDVKKGYQLKVSVKPEVKKGFYYVYR